MQNLNTNRGIGLRVAALSLLTALAASAQSTMTFDYPHFSWGHSHAEAGMVIQTTAEPPGYAYNPIARVNRAVSPNGTSYARYFGSYAQYGEYVTLGREDGSAFGLLAVDLKDPLVPIPYPVPVLFRGFKEDGAVVEQTFVPLNRLQFETFTFEPSFASGLTRVDILSDYWAMDNLVWIPEPAAGSLLVLGLLALAGRRRFFGRPNQR